MFTGPSPYVQLRRGADLAPAFPEIARAAAELGVEVVLDRSVGRAVPGTRPGPGGGSVQEAADL